MNEKEPRQLRGFRGLIRGLEKDEVICRHYIEMDGLRLLFRMVDEGKAQVGPRDAWGNPTFLLDSEASQEFHRRLWDDF